MMPTICKNCNGSGIGVDDLGFSMTGKCNNCTGVGWVDESEEKTIEEKNQEKINDFQNHFNGGSWIK